MKGFVFKRKMGTNSAVNASDDENEDAFDPSSIFGNLLKKDNDIRTDGNKIYFYKPVTRDNVLNLIFTLKQTAKKLKNMSDYIGSTEKVPIYLFINCEGGDYFAGLSAIDAIRTLNHPVYTVIDGMAASAGTFISLAGEKRFIMKNSWVLIHQLKSWLDGFYTHESLKEEMDNSNHFMESLHKLYIENTKIPKKKLNTFFKRDIYIGAEEAIELGIVDEIYNFPIPPRVLKKTKIVIT